MAIDLQARPLVDIAARIKLAVDDHHRLARNTGLSLTAESALKYAKDANSVQANIGQLIGAGVFDDFSGPITTVYDWTMGTFNSWEASATSVKDTLVPAALLTIKNAEADLVPTGVSATTGELIYPAIPALTVTAITADLAAIEAEYTV